MPGGVPSPSRAEVLDMELLGTLPVFVPCTLAGCLPSPRVTLGAGEIITCLSGSGEREVQKGQKKLL